MTEGKEVELPLWLARMLHQKEDAEVVFPCRILSLTQNPLQADPKNFSFFKYPYYFTVVSMLAELFVLCLLFFY